MSAEITRSDTPRTDDAGRKAEKALALPSPFPPPVVFAIAVFLRDGQLHMHPCSFELDSILGQSLLGIIWLRRDLMDTPQAQALRGQLSTRGRQITAWGGDALIYEPTTAE